MHRKNYLLLVLFLFLGSGCASMVQDGHVIGAYSAMRKGKYEIALAELKGAARAMPPSPALQAELGFLEGKCHEELKHTADAMGAYQFVIDKFPDSIFAYQAKGRLAVLREMAAKP